MFCERQPFRIGKIAREFFKSDFPHLSGASGKLSALPWATDSLLRATLPYDHCFSKCQTHLADAPLILLRQKFASSGATIRSTLKRVVFGETEHERGSAGTVCHLCWGDYRGDRACV